MREKIINTLRNNKGTPVSGEMISKGLNISRTAVWKHIQKLKEAGYTIESVYKKGYILHATPDTLLPAEIKTKLKTKWLAKEIVYHAQLKSTNETAKQLAFNDYPHGTLVIAEEQTGGKGRVSRGWYSPFSKGIWFSIILRPPLMPEEASKFTLLMAVVLAETFIKYPGIKVDIKWPNDILINNKKAVGILTEMNAEIGAINYLVIGTGININIQNKDFADDLKNKAISLNDVTKISIDRTKLLAEILNNFEKTYDFIINNGFEKILQDWKKYSITLKKEVRVIAPDKTFIGFAEDLDASGALLVRTKDDILEKVIAGDISIRAVNSDNYV